MDNLLTLPKMGFFLVSVYACVRQVSARDTRCLRKHYNEPWDHRLFNLSFVQQPFPDTGIFQHNQKDDCPTFNDILNTDHVSAQALSLCPWTYVKDLDFNRFPHELFYARCSCKRCVTWSNSGLRHECKAHYHAFNVIRRVCKNGRFRYIHSHDYLPVACVCSHESMHRVGSFR